MTYYTKQIVLPKSESHKGENGKVLVIGGSKLFHAASFWAAAVAAKIVDMVHFSSPVIENNELMRVKAKGKFWNGIVVPWEEVEHYIAEDDCILMGPGMERGEETKEIVDALLAKYPGKRWVVDGGALQEVNPKLLNKNMIITPNARELDILFERTGMQYAVSSKKENKQLVQKLAKQLGCTVLAKGPVDVIVGSEQVVLEIKGGTPAMTKGGTGDVLAGVVAGLYAKSPATAAAVTASQVNKRAGEALAKRVGVYFGASDLLTAIPEVLRQMLKVNKG